MYFSAQFLPCIRKCSGFYNLPVYLQWNIGPPSLSFSHTLQPNGATAVTLCSGFLMGSECHSPRKQLQTSVRGLCQQWGFSDVLRIYCVIDTKLTWHWKVRVSFFCNMYTFQRDTQCCSTGCLLMHRCQLYMFRTVTVHPQELLFRCCMCRLWYVVRTALPDTSRWYNVWGRTNVVPAGRIR